MTNNGRDVAELQSVTNDPLAGHKYTPADPDFTLLQP